MYICMDIKIGKEMLAKPKIMNKAYLLTSRSKGGIKPLLEGGARLEDRWQEEVEESPQFWELILKRCSGEQQTVWSIVECVECL